VDSEQIGSSKGLFDEGIGVIVEYGDDMNL
jgi:hypothetical protein